MTDNERGIERERSQVRFFASTSDMPVNRLEAEAYINEWQRHFEELLATSREHNEPPLVVDPREARLRVGHDSKLFVFRARPDRKAVKMNVVHRLWDEKERSSVPLRSVVAVLAVLLVGLGTAVGWSFLSTKIAPSIFANVGDIAVGIIASAIGGGSDVPLSGAASWGAAAMMTLRGLGVWTNGEGVDGTGRQGWMTVQFGERTINPVGWRDQGLVFDVATNGA